MHLADTMTAFVTAAFPMLIHGAWRLLLALAVLAAFAVAGKAVQHLLLHLAARRREWVSLFRLLGQAARIAALILGAVTALGTLGIDVTAMVASLGLASIAAGLAFKDLLANLVGGVMIIIHQPFRPGDRVTIGSKEGTVESVELRHTVLKEGNKRLLIPNADVLSTPVEVCEASR